MTISIWRYSHFILAISSSLFLFIATITGIILSLEQVSDSMMSYDLQGSGSVALAEVLPKIKEEYDEIITISIDPNHQILASVITKDGASETIFIHPITAKKLGKPNERLAIFEFDTTLHRSLFLKSVGRFFVGFISLLLSFIVISGIAL